MPTQIAIAFSQAPDAQDAVYQAAITAKRQLNSDDTDLVLLLASGAYAGAETCDVIHSILRPRRLVGACAAGLILAEGSFNHGIALLAVNSDEISFASATAHSPAQNNFRNAGFELGRKLNADFKAPQRQACLLFTDLLFQNDTQFIRGAQEVLGLGFPLVGAVGNSNTKAYPDCQFYQKKMLTQSAVGLLIGGANIGIGNKHGFKPLGKPRTVTKSQDNLILTIDQRPAFHIYEEFLGPEAEKMRGGITSLHPLLYPLGIYMEEQRQYLIKNAVDILPNGSIVCQGEVREGAEVHLMIGGRDSCVKSAVEAAHQVKNTLGTNPAKLIIIIESAARHKILKNEVFMEIQAIRDILGYPVPLIGMYTGGEITPLGPGYGINNTHMQNESIVILGLG